MTCNKVMDLGDACMIKGGRLHLLGVGWFFRLYGMGVFFVREFTGCKVVKRGGIRCEW